MEVNEQRDDAPASISVWFLRRWLAHRDSACRAHYNQPFISLT